MVGEILLILVVLGFAWNLGVHYTGAVMGMPYSAHAIRLWPALVLIAVLCFLGATFASAPVETTVGQGIIDDRLVRISDAIMIVLAAGLLTLLYNYWKIPTSTIQILVFCVVGVGLAAGIPIHWATIGELALVWISAPLIAFVLGFVFTRLLDWITPPAAARVHAQDIPDGDPQIAREQIAETAQTAPARNAARYLPALLVLVGAGASFTLGANDVSNATGALIITHLFSLRVAGMIGGLAMAVGALTWGRRILHTVAFDVVKVDLNMASAAQGVQALVVLSAATHGLFTSMNQALIGAMAGAGFARGRETVQRKQILGILRGWLIGPVSGLALAYALETLLRLAIH